MPQPPSTPPYHRDRTDPSQHYERALQQARSEINALKLQVAAHAPSPKAPGIPPWAVGVVAIVTALGGPAVVEVLRTKPPDTMPMLTELQQDVKATRDDLKEIRAVVHRSDSRQELRDDLQNGAICRLNAGKPFARGVDCDAVGEWITSPLGSAAAWRTTTEWPARDRR